jgi:hypothetical protein
MIEEGIIEPITEEPAIITGGCYALTLDVQLDATATALTLTDGKLLVPDRYTVWTTDCSQVSITVRFPTAGGVVTVGAGTPEVTVYHDTDGDLSITFERPSPSEFDVDVTIQQSAPPRGPEDLRPKPVAPTRKVRLLPKIGYPPPDAGED